MMAASNDDSNELSRRQAAKQNEANNNEINTESNEENVEESGQSGEKVEIMSNFNLIYLILPATTYFATSTLLIPLTSM